MSLSYEVKKVSTSVTSHVLKSPKYWGCYEGSGGDTALRLRGERFIDKIEKISKLGYGEGKEDKMEKAFISFMKSYERFGDTKVGRKGGASDTAVRESIWSFLEKSGKAVGIDYHDLDRLWEKVF
jgi:hypothetical protein